MTDELKKWVEEPESGRWCQDSKSSTFYNFIAFLVRMFWLTKKKKKMSSMKILKQ